MRKYLIPLFAAIALLLAGSAMAQVPTYQQAMMEALVGYPDVAASPARVSTSGTSARTATDVPAYSYVRIYCTADTSFRIGNSSVTALTTDPTIPAGSPEVFAVQTGTRVAFILPSGTGSCDVTVLR